jgi:succinate dehydrogenase / fumarate reductase flavoprotein subunit
MYEKITDENPYETPMKIYPAVHYTMGGVWVDYNLQSTIPGCFVAGEANFSDHGANRLGASALMQGLADGYFVLPYTVSDYLASEIRTGHISTDLPEFADAQERVELSINKLLNTNGSKSVDYFHKRLGLIMWNKVGMARNESGLKQAIAEIEALREEFHRDVYVPGAAGELNPELEKALRVADFLELGQLMAMDALQRNESCGGHFREEYQDAEGETLRDDEHFKYVAAWEYKGSDIAAEVLHQEHLNYEFIKIAARNYK